MTINPEDNSGNFFASRARKVMAGVAGGAVIGTITGGSLIRSDKRSLRFDGSLAYRDSFKRIKRVHAARLAHEQARSEQERAAAQARLDKKIEKAEHFVKEDVAYLDKRAAALEIKLAKTKDWDRMKRNRLANRIDKMRELADELLSHLLDATVLTSMSMKLHEVKTDEQMAQYRAQYVEQIVLGGKTSENPFIVYTSPREWHKLLSLQDKAGHDARGFLLSPWNGLVSYQSSVWDQSTMGRVADATPKLRDSNTAKSWFALPSDARSFTVNGYTVVCGEDNVWRTDSDVVGFRLSYDDEGSLDYVASGMAKISFLIGVRERADEKADA